MSVQDLLVFGKLLGGGVPSSAASPTGDISAMIKYLAAQFNENIAPSVDRDGSLIERIAYLQSIAPLNTGLVVDPNQWIGGAGYEFWLGSVHAKLFTAVSATNPYGLDASGWSFSSAVVTNAAGTGDFLSQADDTPAYVTPGPTNGIVGSPSVFGAGAHAHVAARFLGQFPTKLCMEFYAKFTEFAVDTNGTFIGVSGGITAITTPGAVYSNGVNFVLGSYTGTDIGAAADANWHRWRIEIDATETEWFQDDVSQGIIAGAPAPDVFPVSFINRQSTAGNEVGVASVRVWYEL